MATQSATIEVEAVPNAVLTDRTDSQLHQVTNYTAQDVLILGKGVSVALRCDALMVRDNALAKQRSNLCGVPVSSPPSELPIPLYNVLWAEVRDNSLVISYANVSKKHVRPKTLTYAVGDVPLAEVTDWIERLLACAYGSAQRCKRAKVLVNPHAGPGGADKIWEHEVKPLFDAAHMQLDIVRTTFSGEAVGICEQLDVDAYDVIIPCSGDGLPYEVFNGLGKRPDARRALRQLAVAHIPCGSGNAMSINLNGSYQPGLSALAIVKGVRTPMDLVSITQGNRRILSFLSQSLGIIAECDLGTENMRWMGAARFTVGLAQRVFSKKTYPCDVAVKVIIPNKEEIKVHYSREQDEGDFTIRREGNATGATSLDGNSTSSDVDSSEGLPPLKYGTINDKLPGDWETTSHENLGNFYCGNMAYMSPDANFFAAALANDGMMDLVMNDGNISPMKYIDLLTSIETGHFFNNPLISYRKVSAYRIMPRQTEGYISIDGERIPFEPFQAEIHQGLATVLSRNGKYEAAGPIGWKKAAASAKLAGSSKTSPPEVTSGNQVGTSSGAP